MKDKTYYEAQNIKNEIKLRGILSNLPPYCTQFFMSIEATTSSRTRLAYAYDLTVFFDYMHKNNPICAKMEIRDLPISILDQIRPADIEEYIYHLRVYKKGGEDHTNAERGLKRKLSSLRTFYNYFFKNELIDTNPACKVDMPKIHDKAIVRLDVNEMVEMLNKVESGNDLTKRQGSYHEKTKTRDLAIVTLLLGTGIRVSECVGIDIADIDWNNCGVKVHRKGGAEVVVYFGDEVAAALRDYYEERKGITALPENEEAFFLSMQRKRIGVRAVENLVKKYSKLVTSVKNITPHKLRSTYGTNLYRETGDIYLVADVLGHKDVNTTRKHYAALEDERRREAAKHVHLREE